MTVPNTICIPTLLQELEDREKQINENLSLILGPNLDPFPFDRTKEDWKLLQLIKKARVQIQADDLNGLCGIIVEIKEERLPVKNDLD